MSIGKAIKAIRKMRKVSQAELAKRIGLERTSITNIEAGRQSVNEDKINAIADALGYTVHIQFKCKSK